MTRRTRPRYRRPPRPGDAVDALAAARDDRAMSIFVNFPVADVARSADFYSTLGWSAVAEFTNENAACFRIDGDTHIMAISRSFYESLGGTEELVGGPGTPSPVTVAFSVPTRDAVDALAVAAESAGGRLGDTDEYGFMYQRQFDDPDGYHFSPFWADPDAG